MHHARLKTVFDEGHRPYCLLYCSGVWRDVKCYHEPPLLCSSWIIPFCFLVSCHLHFSEFDFFSCQLWCAFGFSKFWLLYEVPNYTCISCWPLLDSAFLNPCLILFSNFDYAQFQSLFFCTSNASLELQSIQWLAHMHTLYNTLQSGINRICAATRTLASGWIYTFFQKFKTSAPPNSVFFFWWVWSWRYWCKFGRARPHIRMLVCDFLYHSNLELWSS
jgi:hypothetical protein